MPAREGVGGGGGEQPSLTGRAAFGQQHRIGAGHSGGPEGAALRGGRFVAGIAGEQFALPEAVAGLRETRNRPKDGEWIVVAASDPLNLVGTLLPGDKVPRTPGNRLLLKDGALIAAWISGEFRPMVTLSVAEATSAQALLQQAPAFRRRNAAQAVLIDATSRINS